MHYLSLGVGLAILASLAGASPCRPHSSNRPSTFLTAVTTTEKPTTAETATANTTETPTTAATTEITTQTTFSSIVTANNTTKSWVSTKAIEITTPILNTTALITTGKTTTAETTSVETTSLKTTTAETPKATTVETTASNTADTPTSTQTSASTTSTNTAVTSTTENLLPTFTAVAGNSGNTAVDGRTIRTTGSVNNALYLVDDGVDSPNYSVGTIYVQDSTGYLMIDDLYIVYNPSVQILYTAAKSLDTILTSDWKKIICTTPASDGSLSCAPEGLPERTQFRVSASVPTYLGIRLDDPNTSSSGYVNIDLLAGATA